MDKEKLVQSLSSNTKKKHSIIGISLFILIFLYLLFSDYGLIKRFSLIYEKSEIKERISTNLEEIEDLKEQRKKPLTDTTEIERTAREKYGYVRKNEHIYVIKENE